MMTYFLQFSIGIFPPATRKPLIQNTILPNIFTFQETRNYPIPSSPSYNIINSIRENNQGGGVAISIQIQFNYKNISDTIPQELKESNLEIIILQLFHPLFSLILLNVYIPINAKFGKKNMKIFQDWIIHMMHIQQNMPIIVCGDFNQSKSPLPFMNDLTQNVKFTFKRPFKQHIRRSKLDWILCNQQLKYICQNKWYNKVSDHSLIYLRIVLEQKDSTKNNNILKFPDRQAATKICDQAVARNTNPENFLSDHQKIAKQTRKDKAIRIKINQFQPQKSTFEELLNSIDSQIRTRDSKLAFSAIKRLCILHPQKRDGDTFKCFINANGQVITDQIAIKKNFLTQIGTYSHLKETSITNMKNSLKNTIWPNLQPLSLIETVTMQEHMSFNKALVFDGFIDTWFKKPESINYIFNLWNNSSMQQISIKSFNARLIPLNKKWPAIPSHKDLRPIVVLSPIIKWLELLFLSKIQNYMSSKMDKNQIGFVPRMQTQVNIKSICREIRTSKKSDKKCCIFIDLRSAYNTIFRTKIYELLREKGILTDEETQFLQKLQDLIYFRVEKDAYQFENGVHQGSILSPGLFNIYMEDIICILKESLPFDFSYKMFADDIVVIIKIQHITRFVRNMKKIFEEKNLQFNADKSGILAIKNAKISEQDIKEAHIPIVASYRLLGVVIDHKGSIQPHIKEMKNRIAYLHTTMRKITFSLSLLKIKHQYGVYTSNPTLIILHTYWMKNV